MDEHTDAARLEATRDAIRTGTAPRPRVEGEAEHHFGDQAEPHRSEVDRIERERDEARTAVARLRAEVERLTKERRAIDAGLRLIHDRMATDLTYPGFVGSIECLLEDGQIPRSWTAALPTPAPEARNG